MLRDRFLPVSVDLNLNSATFGAICAAVAVGPLSAWWLILAFACLIRFPSKGAWDFVWTVGKGWRGGWRQNDAA